MASRRRRLASLGIAAARDALRVLMLMVSSWLVASAACPHVPVRTGSASPRRLECSAHRPAPASAGRAVAETLEHDSPWAAVSARPWAGAGSRRPPSGCPGPDRGRPVHRWDRDPVGGCAGAARQGSRRVAWPIVPSGSRWAGSPSRWNSPISEAIVACRRPSGAAAEAPSGRHMMEPVSSRRSEVPIRRPGSSPHTSPPS